MKSVPAAVGSGMIPACFSTAAGAVCVAAQQQRVAAAVAAASTACCSLSIFQYVCTYLSRLACGCIVDLLSMVQEGQRQVPRTARRRRDPRRRTDPV
eukprot:COSAG02_NODE_3094_length_7380_cov_2.503089_6_plen_97_part_00